jgi:hypothetical protein
MKIGAKYQCIIPTAECVRLLRESSYASVGGDDGRFGLGAIAGFIKPNGSSSIIKARLSVSFWTDLKVPLEITLMMFGAAGMYRASMLPKLILSGWLLLVAVIVLAQLADASKAFDKLRMILPPEQQHGFEMVTSR